MGFRLMFRRISLANAIRPGKCQYLATFKSMKTTTSTMWRLEGDFFIFKSKCVRRSEEIST